MLRFHPLATDTTRALQSGATDAHGQPPERTTSTGPGNPCRHCLNFTPQGAGMLVLAYRPFPAPQPYAEVGPIFLCADPCAPYAASGELPPILQTSPAYLLRGYGGDDRICYGTGGIVPQVSMESACHALFSDSAVEYIHVRSASYNCYQCRITRA